MSAARRPIRAIRVELDDEQIDRLMPVLEVARRAGDGGAPGMLLAQVFGAHMLVFFIDAQAAMECQRVLGHPVGLTTEDVRRAGSTQVGRA